MVKTTREKDNHEVFNGLTSQTLLQNYHFVVDTADDLMEVSNKSIDRYIKDKKKGNDYEKELEKAFKVKNETEQLGGKKTSEVIKRTLNYLKKPQTAFEPQPDNSYFQFVPLISHKDNALEPLNPKIKELQANYIEYLRKNPKIEFDPERSIKYEQVPHPYEREIIELDFDWTKMAKDISELDPKMPGPTSESNYEFIETQEQLSKLISDLSNVTEIAVDLEYHSYRSYQGFVCLMQLSTREKDYIIDTIALRSHMHTFNDIFTNPKIVKVLHGSNSDIQWLQKDFGIYVVNLFDTGLAAKVLGMKASLQFLLKHYCDVDADKSYQLADWRLRPLTKEMLNYA